MEHLNCKVVGASDIPSNYSMFLKRERREKIKHENLYRLHNASVKHASGNYFERLSNKSSLENKNSCLKSV